jgi:hypothetical protein
MSAEEFDRAARLRGKVITDSASCGRPHRCRVHTAPARHPVNPPGNAARYQADGGRDMTAYYRRSTERSPIHGRSTGFRPLPYAPPRTRLASAMSRFSVTRHQLAQFTTSRFNSAIRLLHPRPKRLTEQGAEFSLACQPCRIFAHPALSAILRPPGPAPLPAPTSSTDLPLENHTIGQAIGPLFLSGSEHRVNLREPLGVTPAWVRSGASASVRTNLVVPGGLRFLLIATFISIIAGRFVLRGRDRQLGFQRR